MKIFIATPSMGGLMKAAYVNSLVSIINELQTLGAEFTFCNLDGSSIVLARNFLANSFLKARDYTHILFLDSDMVVPEGVVSALLTRSVDVAGGIYGEKSFDFAQYDRQLSDVGADMARALASRFTTKVELEDGAVRMEDGFIRVSRIGFGCILIRRSAFQKMILNGVVDVYNPDKFTSYGLHHPVYDFFSELWTSEGELLSEDYSFCERYLGMEDTEIWGLANEKFGHVGDFTYGARFSDRLKAGVL